MCLCVIDWLLRLAWTTEVVSAVLWSASSITGVAVHSLPHTMYMRTRMETMLIVICDLFVAATWLFSPCSVSSISSRYNVILRTVMWVDVSLCGCELKGNSLNQWSDVNWILMFMTYAYVSAYAEWTSRFYVGFNKSILLLRFALSPLFTLKMYLNSIIWKITVKHLCMYHMLYCSIHCLILSFWIVWCIIVTAYMSTDLC